MPVHARFSFLVFRVLCFVFCVLCFVVLCFCFCLFVFYHFIMFIFFSDAYCVGLSVPKWSCYCCYVYAERQCRVHPFAAGSRIADQKAMLPFLYQDVESCGEVQYQFGYGGSSSFKCRGLDKLEIVFTSIDIKYNSN